MRATLVCTQILLYTLTLSFTQIVHTLILVTQSHILGQRSGVRALGPRSHPWPFLSDRAKMVNMANTCTTCRRISRCMRLGLGLGLGLWTPR